MTDKELAELRIYAEEAIRALDGSLTIPQDRLILLVNDYAERFPRIALRLVDEVARWREIGRAVADGRLSYSEQPDGWVCALCDAFTPGEWGRHDYSPESESDRGKRVIQHADDCPVTLARALLGDDSA